MEIRRPPTLQRVQKSYSVKIGRLLYPSGSGSARYQVGGRNSRPLLTGGLLFCCSVASREGARTQVTVHDRCAFHEAALINIHIVDLMTVPLGC